jgi:hypothetical protein
MAHFRTCRTSDPCFSFPNYLSAVADAPAETRDKVIVCLIADMATKPNKTERLESFIAFIDSADNLEQDKRAKIVESHSKSLQEVTSPIGSLALDSELIGSIQINPSSEVLAFLKESLDPLPQYKLEDLIERMSPEALNVLKNVFWFSLPQLTQVIEETFNSTIDTNKEQEYRKINEQTFYENLPAYKRDYGEEYIGIVNGQVVAHNKNLKTVMAKLETLEPDLEKRFIAKPDANYDDTAEIL